MKYIIVHFFIFLLLRHFQISEGFDEDADERPQIIHVNLDPQLLLLLREVRHLSQPPFNTHLPPPAKELLRNTNSYELSVTAARLETVVSNYNAIMRTLTPFEKPLFERKLAQIDMVCVQHSLNVHQDIIIIAKWQNSIKSLDKEHTILEIQSKTINIKIN